MPLSSGSSEDKHDRPQTPMEQALLACLKSYSDLIAHQHSTIIKLIDGTLTTKPE